MFQFSRDETDYVWSGKFYNNATMAEWSKAADLSSVIRTNAWVRTPLVVFILSLQILSIVTNLLKGM